MNISNKCKNFLNKINEQPLNRNQFLKQSEGIIMLKESIMLK